MLFVQRDIDNACVGVPVPRDHDDVTNSHRQPIYSSVNDTDDVNNDEPNESSSTSSSSSSAVAAVPTPLTSRNSGLSKYLHETPI